MFANFRLNSFCLSLCILFIYISAAFCEREIDSEENILIDKKDSEDEEKPFLPPALPIVKTDSGDEKKALLRPLPIVRDFDDYSSADPKSIDHAYIAELEANKSNENYAIDNNIIYDRPVVFSCDVPIPKINERSCLPQENYILPSQGVADFRGCVNIERSSRIDIGTEATVSTSEDSYLHIGKQARLLVQGDLKLMDNGVLMYFMSKAIIEPNAHLYVSGESITEGGDPRHANSLVLFPHANMTIEGTLKQKYGATITAYNNATFHVGNQGTAIMHPGSKLVIVSDASIILNGYLEISQGNIVDMQGYPDTVNISGIMEIITEECPAMEFKLSSMYVSGQFSWKSCGLFKFYVSSVIVTGKMIATNGENNTPGIVELSSSRLIVVGNMTVAGGIVVVFDGELLVIGDLKLEEGASLDVMVRCTILGSVTLKRNERLVMKNKGKYAQNAIECEK